MGKNWLAVLYWHYFHLKPGKLGGRRQKNTQRKTGNKGSLEAIQGTSDKHQTTKWN